MIPIFSFYVKADFRLPAITFPEAVAMPVNLVLNRASRKILRYALVALVGFALLRNLSI